MAKTILQKMFFKPEYSSVFLHIPQELQEELSIANKVDDDLIEAHDFVLGFYITKAALEKDISALKRAVKEKGLLWVAYPKGKLLATDLNRDILHASMQRYGLDGVSLVSISDTWSAMRFKQ